MSERREESGEFELTLGGESRRPSSRAIAHTGVLGTVQSALSGTTVRLALSINLHIPRSRQLDAALHAVTDGDLVPVD
ncbi:MAG: hypothetical protein EOP31_26495 [Rhodococcus sp. (in: high G+C Gram-positive bacteria)]|nr:MAG: hypothetical protein EOP31_26495 [Rhodococcus sp. (in: high G+C Gram-positive bacteria)]